MAHVAASKAGNVILVLGNDQGLDCYHYLLVPDSKLPALQRAVAGEGKVSLGAFGLVIVSGFGQPDEAVKKKMLEEYGFSGA